MIPLGILATTAGGAAAGSYELISSTILTSTTDNITFSSIPQTYKHLQIRATPRKATSAGTGAFSLDIRLNGNTGSVYSYHDMTGNATSVVSNGFGTQNQIRFDASIPSNSQSAGIFGATIIDILDYASTSKYKTLRGLAGYAGSSYRIGLKSGLYQATTAVSSIVLFDYDYATGFLAGSRFSLYGILG
jgi:hypothetical protein